MRGKKAVAVILGTSQVTYCFGKRGWWEAHLSRGKIVDSSGTQFRDIFPTIPSLHDRLDINRDILGSEILLVCISYPCFKLFAGSLPFRTAALDFSSTGRSLTEHADSSLSADKN